MIRTVIWDWNGTLLDDVDSCVATLNVLRARRGLLPLSREEYRASFGFPVRAFYESIGFDFSADDYTALSRDFIAEYRRRASEMQVSAGARQTLGRLGARGIGHIVISAMESALLGEMLSEHGLIGQLQGFFGTADHGAGSKVAIGTEAARGVGLGPDELLVVGDTLHDLELARAIGCRALLYAGGHQDHARLAGHGVPVIDRFEDLDQHLGQAAFVAEDAEISASSADKPAAELEHLVARA